jgi:hypothetical protein
MSINLRELICVVRVCKTAADERGVIVARAREAQAWHQAGAQDLAVVLRRGGAAAPAHLPPTTRGGLQTRPQAWTPGFLC